MSWPLAAGLIVAVLVVAVVVAASWVWSRQANIAKARAWAISGPPCPAATAQAFAATPDQPTKGFDFDNVTFAYAFGNASCDEIHDDGGRAMATHPACQFTSPVTLKVTTRRGDYFFTVPTGPATVTVADGVAACVRAARPQ